MRRRYHCLGEVVAEACGVVVAGLNDDDAVLAAVLECVACHDSALEGVNVGYTEVVVVAEGDLGVGAGGADRGELRGSEEVASRDGAAGAVSTDDDGDAVAYQQLSGGGRLLGGGAVISIDKLYIIGLAVYLDGGIQGMCIFDTKDLLLATAAFWPLVGSNTPIFTTLLPLDASFLGSLLVEPHAHSANNITTARSIAITFFIFLSSS